MKELFELYLSRDQKAVICELFFEHKKNGHPRHKIETKGYYVVEVCPFCYSELKLIHRIIKEKGRHEKVLICTNKKCHYLEIQLTSAEIQRLNWEDYYVNV